MSPRPRPQRPASDRLLRSQSSASSSPTLHQLFLHLRTKITAQQEPGSFQLEGIPAEVGYPVARKLAEDGDVERANPRITNNPIVQRFSFTMPHPHQSSVATWARQEQEEARARGFFTSDESIDLEFVRGSRFDNFPAPWENIYKEPDGAWVVGAALMPSIVLETGYLESWPKVQEVRDLWLQGGAPFANAIVLVQWAKRSNGRVAGFIEVHRPGGQQVTRIDIFPRPQPGTPPQRIIWHRRDFYPNGIVPQGRNPNDVWAWDIDLLRRYATRRLAREGLLPF